MANAPSISSPCHSAAVTTPWAVASLQPSGLPEGRAQCRLAAVHAALQRIDRRLEIQGHGVLWSLGHARRIAVWAAASRRHVPAATG
jgi:hypothetical protein